MSCQLIVNRQTIRRGRLPQDRYGLALVRSFWADEGTCVFEALSVPGEASVAVEFGSWHLKSTDRGPATLCVDVAIPSDLTPNNDELLGKLLDVALMRGAAWGIEAREALS